MSEAATDILNEDELTLTPSAQSKMGELVGQVEEEIKGLRVYATPGGCSGINFGMTFTDQLNDNDKRLSCEGFDVIVDSDTLQHLAGVEIDFVDQGDGNASFVFNNLQQMGGGCGTCGSAQGGGCA
jgi:iron-sulfur cluster insertion protein